MCTIRVFNFKTDIHTDKLENRILYLPPIGDDKSRLVSDVDFFFFSALHMSMFYLRMKSRIVIIVPIHITCRHRAVYVLYYISCSSDPQRRKRNKKNKNKNAA